MYGIDHLHHFINNRLQFCHAYSINYQLRSANVLDFCIVVIKYLSIFINISVVEFFLF